MDMRTVEVPAKRLADGRWNHEKNRNEGEGDIPESYSADVIGESSSRIRRPFLFENEYWVCVGRCANEADAYRIKDPRMFDRAKTTYREKTRDCEAARNDPNGFYDGMVIKWGGTEYVLTGPEVRFHAQPVPEEAPVAEQQNLFGG